MRYYSTIIISFFTLALVTSCSKNNSSNTPIVAATDTSFDPTKATLLKQGTFTGNMSYTVTGTVKLYEYQNKKYIYFQNFSSNNGPDLKVYVATNNAAAQFVSLGVLKGTSGTQAYEVTNPPDFAVYNKVLIWCQQFSVLFGTSTLQ